MTKTLRNLSVAGVAITLFALSACNNKKPSVLKVFVRSSNNELIGNAAVVVIADVGSNPPTPEYVDTVYTNSSGFATFDMDPFFDKLGKKETTGYFDIIARKETSQGNGYIQCRSHNTAVETVYLQP